MRRINTRVIGAVLDELDAVYGEIASKIHARCKPIFECITRANYKIDKDGVVSRKFKERRFLIKVKAGDDEALPILAAVRKITQELWNSNIDKLFDDTWQVVIKNMLLSLPPKWADAIPHKEWRSLLTRLLNLVGIAPSDHQYRIKSVLLDGLARSLLCVHFWKTVIGKYHPDIKDKLAQSKTWTPSMFEVFFSFVLKNWNKLFAQFWSPSKLLDVNAITNFHLLGFRFLKIAVFMYHSDVSKSRFTNLKTFINSNIDVRHYGFGSQLNGLHYPNFLTDEHFHDEINDLLWNIHDDDEHITTKNNFDCIPLWRKLCDEHYHDFEKLWGQAKYAVDKGIESDVFKSGETFEERVITLFSQYESNWHPLGPADITRIHVTMDTLGKLDSNSMYTNPQYVYGICHKVREIAEESYVVFVYIFSLCRILHKYLTNVFLFFIVLLCFVFLDLLKLAVNRRIIPYDSDYSHHSLNTAKTSDVDSMSVLSASFTTPLAVRARKNVSRNVKESTRLSQMEERKRLRQQSQYSLRFIAFLQTTGNGKVLRKDEFSAFIKNKINVNALGLLGDGFVAQLSQSLSYAIKAGGSHQVDQIINQLQLVMHQLDQCENSFVTALNFYDCPVEKKNDNDEQDDDDDDGEDDDDMEGHRHICQNDDAAVTSTYAEGENDMIVDDNSAAQKSADSNGVTKRNLVKKLVYFFGMALQHPTFIKRVREYILMQGNADFYHNSIPQNKGDSLISTGLLTIYIGIAVVCHQYEYCSRVVTQKQNNRNLTAKREFKLSEDVQAWLVEGMNRRDSFIFLNVMQPVINDNLHALQAFDVKDDIQVTINSCVAPISLADDPQGVKATKLDNRKGQHLQSHLALQLYTLNVLPLLPYLVSKKLEWNYENIGEALSCFKEFWYDLVKMTYWDAAYPISNNANSNGNNNNANSNSNNNKYKVGGRRIFSQQNDNSNDNSTTHKNANVAAMRGTSPATKAQMISYKQQLSWAIIVFNLAQRVSGNLLFVEAIDTLTDGHPFTAPTSTALRTFSNYSVNRKFDKVTIPARRLLALRTFNAYLIRNGGHRVITPAERVQFNNGIDKLLKAMHKEYNMIHLTDYNRSTINIQFWKDQHFRAKPKTASKSKSKKPIVKDPIGDARFVCNHIDYGYGWKYSHEKQAQLCKSFHFVNCIPLMTKYGCGFPHYFNWRDLEAQAPDDYGYTDSEGEQQQQQQQGDKQGDKQQKLEKGVVIDDDDSKRHTLPVTPGLPTTQLAQMTINLDETDDENADDDDDVMIVSRGALRGGNRCKYDCHNNNCNGQCRRNISKNNHKHKSSTNSNKFSKSKANDYLNLNWSSNFASSSFVVGGVSTKPFSTQVIEDMTALPVSNAGSSMGSSSQTVMSAAQRRANAYGTAAVKPTNKNKSKSKSKGKNKGKTDKSKGKNKSSTAKTDKSKSKGKSKEKSNKTEKSKDKSKSKNKTKSKDKSNRKNKTKTKSKDKSSSKNTTKVKGDNNSNDAIISGISGIPPSVGTNIGGNLNTSFSFSLPTQMSQQSNSNIASKRKGGKKRSHVVLTQDLYDDLAVASMGMNSGIPPPTGLNIWGNPVEPFPLTPASPTPTLRSPTPTLPSPTPTLPSPSPPKRQRKMRPSKQPTSIKAPRIACHNAVQHQRRIYSQPQQHVQYQGQQQQRQQQQQRIPKVNSWNMNEIFDDMYE